MEAILGFGVIMTQPGKPRYEWVPDAKDTHPKDLSESKQVTQNSVELVSHSTAILTF